MAKMKGSAKARYNRLEADRETYLNRARRCSELTIPTLIPPSGHGPATQYETPWQGLGARCVNNLASKLLLSQLPPNTPFFRLKVDDFTLEKMTGQEGMRAKAEEGLNKIERAVQDDIETGGYRSPVFEAFKHMIVGGNALIYLPKESLRVFSLESYVVRRDTKGNLLEVIICEKVDKETLDEDILQATELEAPSLQPEEAPNSEHDIEVYTRMYRDDNMWVVYQEINEKVVPDTKGKYKLDECPMLPLRWTRVEGENYGRSYVEEYLGDLIALEGLSRSICEAAAASSKVLFFISPNSYIDAKTIAKAESGDFVVGRADDVTVLQTEKYADLRIAFEAMKQISERLQFAFLMNTAIQRQAERVTAEEIRYMAGELEDALGGTYSIMSQEFQLLFVNRLMARMAEAGKLPRLPKDVVKPSIVTGIEALGRGHDLNKLQVFAQGIMQTLGPEIAAQYINVDDFIKRYGTSLGIDMKGLVKSPEQIAQEQAQAQQQQQNAMLAEMAGKAIPNAVKAVGDSMNTQTG